MGSNAPGEEQLQDWESQGWAGLPAASPQTASPSRHHGTRMPNGLRGATRPQKAASRHLARIRPSGFARETGRQLSALSTVTHLLNKGGAQRTGGAAHLAPAEHAGLWDTSLHRSPGPHVASLSTPCLPALEAV